MADNTGKALVLDEARGTIAVGTISIRGNETSFIAAEKPTSLTDKAAAAKLAGDFFRQASAVTDPGSISLVDSKAGAALVIGPQDGTAAAAGVAGVLGPAQQATVQKPDDIGFGKTITGEAGKAFRNHGFTL